MRYQNEQLPVNAIYNACTGKLTEKTIPPPILKRHMAPRGKYGLLSVKKGGLQLIFDDTGDLFDVDAQHPLVIHPERNHHIQLTGPVTFEICFYSIPDEVPESFDSSVPRPGERYISSQPQ